MPDFTEATLQQMKVKSKDPLVATLTSICNKYHIRKGKEIHMFISTFIGSNKEGYVQNILTMANTIHHSGNELEQVEKFVKTRYFSGSSAVHEMYVTRFNAVDLGDRYYSKVDDGHRVHDWHTKLFFALLKLGTINSYIR